MEQILISYAGGEGTAQCNPTLPSFQTTNKAAKNAVKLEIGSVQHIDRTLFDY